MSDYKPLTVVDDETSCPTEVLIERIKQSREQNSATTISGTPRATRGTIRTSSVSA
jgi:hypothetical protein